VDVITVVEAAMERFGVPEHLRSGFQFRFPNMEDALRDLDQRVKR
jgi:hypothetical protein